MTLGLLSLLPPRKKIDGLPLAQRIEQSSMPVTECGCWIWLGTGSRLGYGMTSVRSKAISAHRASWEAFRGPIPKGLHVLHQCDVPSCVNPDHLKLGTIADNAAERSRRDRRGNWHLTASVVATSPKKRTGFSPQERIERLSIPEPNSGCWLFLGATRLGYGRLQNPKTKKSESVHRLAWEAYRGPIPAGLHVLHQCDNPICCNPDHLFLGTHIENMADRRRKKRCASWLGEDHPYAKLTNADVTFIRTSALSQQKLAETFGITRAAIKAIRQRKTWKHLP